MAKGKKIREKGKIKFSRYFQELNIGDVVSIDIEKSVPFNFPKRIQGKTGVVVGKRGKRFYIIKVGKEKKEFIIEPVHLKKIKT